LQVIPEGESLRLAEGILMSTIVKMVLAGVALIALAFVFPTVNWIYDYADGNGTGLLHQAGTPTNNAMLLILPFLIPAIIGIGIVIFVARRNSGGGGQ
jgi:hypothetical protein